MRSDGRHARSERSREAVVAAMLDLLRQTGARPSAQDVADRAGLSIRTVFRHFDDTDALFGTAIELQMQHVGDRVGLLGPMSVDDFVACRAALFEEIAPVRRAGLLEADHPAVQDGLARGHQLLRAQVKSVFDVDGVTLDAIDAITSWGAWDALRTDQRLSVPKAREVVSLTIKQLLKRR